MTTVRNTLNQALVAWMDTDSLAEARQLKEDLDRLVQSAGAVSLFVGPVSFEVVEFTPSCVWVKTDGPDQYLGRKFLARNEVVEMR